VQQVPCAMSFKSTSFVLKIGSDFSSVKVNFQIKSLSILSLVKSKKVQIKNLIDRKQDKK